MKYLIISLIFLCLFDRAYAVDIFKNKTKLADPLKLRDPFRSSRELKTSKNAKNAGSGSLRNGIYTNLSSIDNVPLSQIRITGVIIGKDRRAIAKIGESTSNKPGIILKEGMKIGEDQAEIKAILPGGIVLVEKIVNVYGQDEYLETVIPISK